MSGFGSGQDAEPQSSLTSLECPVRLIRETVVSWNLLRDNGGIPDEDLEDFAQLLVVAFEDDGYPLTDLHLGHVEIGFVGGPVIGMVERKDKIMMLRKISSLTAELNVVKFRLDIALNM